MEYGRNSKRSNSESNGTQDKFGGKHMSTAGKRKEELDSKLKGGAMATAIAILTATAFTCPCARKENWRERVEGLTERRALVK